MRNYSDKALRSFFGAREGGQDRPQNINTPRFLINAILKLWPKGIELDPCSNVYSKVPARHKVIAKEIVNREFIFHKKLVLDDIFIGSPKYPVNKNGGLSIDWPNYTYANVPYRDLKPWLWKPVPTMEHLVLCPVRTNRTWFCEAMNTATTCCFLRPFAFDGHIQCYPTPLIMVYWGCYEDRFTDAFWKYGMIGNIRATQYAFEEQEEYYIEQSSQMELDLQP